MRYVRSFKRFEILSESNERIFSELDKKKMWGWHRSFANRYYKDEQAALADVMRVVGLENDSSWGKLFGKEDPKYVASLFDYVNTPKGVQIKPKVKPPASGTDNDLIRRQKNLWEFVHGIEMGRYFSKVQYIETRDRRIIGTEKVHDENVQEIMNKLKSGDPLPPILLDYDYGILDGHHRWEAAKRLRIKKIPVVVYENPGYVGTS